MKVLVIISLLVAVTYAAVTTKGPVAGGIVDADVNSEGVQDAAKFAYQMISASINSVHAMKIGKITKAQSQVVAGVKYYLTIEVEETDCAKTVTDTSGCKVVKTETCEAQVLSRPWDTLHKKELLSYQCHSDSA